MHRSKILCLLLWCSTVHGMDSLTRLFFCCVGDVSDEVLHDIQIYPGDSFRARLDNIWGNAENNEPIIPNKSIIFKDMKYSEKSGVYTLYSDTLSMFENYGTKGGYSLTELRDAVRRNTLACNHVKSISDESRFAYHRNDCYIYSPLCLLLCHYNGLTPEFIKKLSVVRDALALLKEERVIFDSEQTVSHYGRDRVEYSIFYYVNTAYERASSIQDKDDIKAIAQYLVAMRIDRGDTANISFELMHVIHEQEAKNRLWLLKDRLEKVGNVKFSFT